LAFSQNQAGFSKLEIVVEIKLQPAHHSASGWELRVKITLPFHREVFRKGRGEWARGHQMLEIGDGNAAENS
jgi:hypothetical protein